jgi:DNA-binding protein
MSWIPNALMSGIQSIFQGAAGSEISRRETALEGIRKAMLRELDYSGIRIS